MDLVLCHVTADFDTLGAAVGISRLHPGTRIVLTGGCHPTVRDFLALHRDEYPLIERRSVSPDQIRSITVVDTQRRDRLGKAASWLDLRDRPITVYDHHLTDYLEGDTSNTDPATTSQATPSQATPFQGTRSQATSPQPISNIAATHRYVEAVGAATTLVVEQLQQRAITLTPIEATVMALGIHVDTGSLTFGHTTARDAAALTWLIEQGANLRVVAEYVEPGLSPTLQDLVPVVLAAIETKNIEGISVAWAILNLENHTSGLSSLVSRVMALTESDVLILATYFAPPNTPDSSSYGGGKLTLIGRSRGGSFGTAHLDSINLGQIFRKWGGGGHAKAAAATFHLNPVNALKDGLQVFSKSPSQNSSKVPSKASPQDIVAQIIGHIEAQLPSPPTARTVMSSPVRTVRPDISIAEAHRILLRYGHSGLSVVDQAGQLVGVISRRDLDIALHHNFSHAPVKGFMSTNLKTIDPDVSLPEIESLMVTYDIGRLPVLDDGELVGIVTRTDVLRQLHQTQFVQTPLAQAPLVQFSQLGRPSPRFNQNLALNRCPLPQAVVETLRDRLVPELWTLLQDVAQQAEARGWQLYVVGGAVRDLLLAKSRAENEAKDGAKDDAQAPSPLLIPDIDLVVDGCHQTESAAGVELARALCDRYPNARLQVHGRFQTAALLWHNDPVLESLWIDIATARTEFYPYPAANPEVEASSIRQDLYRRDFTINALAIRLTSPRTGELLDFFGGVLDLEARHIRVLHANSFIEDPTRIFRAVRFAVRLGFELESQTRRYIEHAIASGIYHRVQTEMEVIPALQTRLRRELQYILEAPYWKVAIQLLADLDALQCIHASLHLSSQIWWQLRLVDRWLRRFDQAGQLAHWLVLLEVLISHLDAPHPKAVAEKLQLPAESIHRLGTLKTHQATLQQTLIQPPTSNLSSNLCSRLHNKERRSHAAETIKPSTIVSHLKSYDLPSLILIGVRSDRPLRRLIWQYLTHWSRVRAPLNGNDLKALGYKPGRQFKLMLDQLLAATLDGHIHTPEDAKMFLSTQILTE
ncbi:MAG: CBS domain-containing protein [Symploca sp. SIO2B6]|nr:CBS domain-containing protein [Symploca sp. SIO2B6]